MNRIFAAVGVGFALLLLVGVALWWQPDWTAAKNAIFNGGTRGVAAAGPTINEFTSADAEVEEGTATTLRWKTSDATEVSLNNNKLPELNGSQTITPTTKPETTYTLVAKGSGPDETKSVVIKVKAKAAAPAAPTPAVPAPAATQAPQARGLAAPSSCPESPKHFDAVGTPPDPTKGHVVQIKNGCVAVGDIAVADNQAGLWYLPYDSDSKTGLVVMCDNPQGCWFRMDFGGDVNAPQTTDDLVKGILASGCGSSCASVKSINWPSERCAMDAKGITGPFFGKDACIPAPAPSPSPTATPTPAAPPIRTQAFVPTGECAGELQALVIKLAKAGCIITGDVEAYIGPPTTSAPALPETLTATNVGDIKKMLQQNWHPLHDSIQNTGAVVKITRDTWVMPLYRGAGLHTEPATVQSLQLGELMTGCDIAGGCVKIDATYSSYP